MRIRQIFATLALAAVFTATPSAPEPVDPAFTPVPVRYAEWRQAEDGTLYEVCLIKGNIRKHDRIYHVPGWRDYEKTIITESKGERWFCTIEEAEAAGWRAPKYVK